MSPSMVTSGKSSTCVQSMLQRTLVEAWQKAQVAQLEEPALRQNDDRADVLLPMVAAYRLRSSLTQVRAWLVVKLWW